MYVMKAFFEAIFFPNTINESSLYACSVFPYFFYNTHLLMMLRNFIQLVILDLITIE